MKKENLLLGLRVSSKEAMMCLVLDQKYGEGRARTKKKMMTECEARRQEKKKSCEGSQEEAGSGSKKATQEKKKNL